MWLSWMLRSADWRRIHVHRCHSCRRRFADDEPGCIPPGEERFPQLCRCDLQRDLGHTNCRASGPYCPACAARITEEQREIDEWEREWLLTGPSASPRLPYRPRAQSDPQEIRALCTCHQCRGNNRTLGIASLIYALTRGNTNGWAEAGTLTAFALGAVLLLAFAAAERLSRAPMLPASVIRDRNRGGAGAVMLLLRTGMLAMYYLLTLYMQLVRSYSALHTGLAYLPNVAGLGIAVGGLGSRRCPRGP